MLEVDAQLLVDVHRQAGAVETGDGIGARVDVRDAEVVLGDGDRSLPDRPAGERSGGTNRQRGEASETEHDQRVGLRADGPATGCTSSWLRPRRDPDQELRPGLEPEGGLAEGEPEADDADAPLAPDSRL